MNKEFVPYELAVKLKKLGFDEECFAYWGISQIPQTEGEVMLEKRQVSMTGNLAEKVCLAPTFSQAFRWFREKYMLVGVPTHQSYDIWNTITGECFIEIYPLNSYEEAELACLIKLIEIVEQQKQK